MQEACEEWDQCEHKIKEIRGWIEKTKQNLDSAQHRRKPLRDQLGHHEKTLADINVQRTKLRLSIEKLEVIQTILVCFGVSLLHTMSVSMSCRCYLGTFPKRYGR